MPGPPPKTRTRRVSRKRRHIADFGVVEGGAVVVPEMPRGLCRQAQEAWDEFWGDRVSGMSRSADAVVALRWVKHLDRYYRLLALADSEPVVKGSTGQPRPNPVYDLAFKIESAIAEAERQLGIGVLNRLRLGATFNDGALTLAQLNAIAEDDADEADDFRLTLLAGSVETTPEEGA